MTDDKFNTDDYDDLSDREIAQLVSGMDGEALDFIRQNATELLHRDDVVAFGLTTISGEGGFNSRIAVNKEGFPDRLFEGGELNSPAELEAALIGYRLADSFEKLSRLGEMDTMQEYVEYIVEMAEIMHGDIYGQQSAKPPAHVMEQMKDELAKELGLAGKAAGEAGGQMVDEADDSSGFNIDIEDVGDGNGEDEGEGDDAE